MCKSCTESNLLASTIDGSVCNVSYDSRSLEICVCVWQVHPNAERPAHLRLKMYEFAGRVVGKCLYESALGGAYKQLVRARFTRSFLAQIIGLRMNYKVVHSSYFAHFPLTHLKQESSTNIDRTLSSTLIISSYSQERYGRCFSMSYKL